MSEHSAVAINDVRKVVEGVGGKCVLLAAGEGGSFYAGLGRPAAEHLLDAALTFFADLEQYDDIAVFTSSNSTDKPHLPEFRVAETFKVGRGSGGWMLRGNHLLLNSSSPKPENDNSIFLDDDDLEDLNSDRTSLKGDYPNRCFYHAHNLSWSDRLSNVLGEIESRAGCRFSKDDYIYDDQTYEGRKALVVVDSLFIQPPRLTRFDLLQSQGSGHPEIPEQDQLQSMQWRFRNFAQGFDDQGKVDVVFLCSSTAEAKQIIDGSFTNMPQPQNPGEPDFQPFGSFPLPSIAEIVIWEMVDYKKPFGSFYENAGFVNNLKEILTNKMPIIENKIDALEELKGMVGMADLVASVEGHIAYLEEQKAMEKLGMVQEPIPYHAVFFGPPGTGKTTVARILAQLYADLGLLSGKKFHEVTKTDLIAEFEGQTMPKTRATCENAYGGVLFIDEAYMLLRDKSDPFGIESIVELMKWMEDNHRENLAVFFAGYHKEMNAFFSIANPGLFGRTGSNHFYLNDYSDDDLLEIAIRKATKWGQEIENEAKDLIKKRLSSYREACSGAGIYFRNAAVVIDLLNAAKKARSLRNKGKADRDVRVLTSDDFKNAKMSPPRHV